MKKVMLGSMILVLTACVQYSARSALSVNQYEKRLNTIACHDRDDWYLDGYRVGKDFPEYSQSQLAQRVQFCGSLSQAQRSTWLDGFEAGTHGDDIVTVNNDDDFENDEDEE